MQQMPYSTEILILALIIIVLVIIYFIVYRFKNQESVKNSYVAALECLADGDHKRAIQRFKEAVRENSENIEAYLRLGDLLREKGFAKNALKIHRDLTLRSNLDAEKESRVRRSLVADYEAVGDFTNAINSAGKLLEQGLGNSDEMAKKLLVFYEKEKRWSDAFTAGKKYFKKGAASSKKMALYLVFQGLDLLEREKGREARTKFKEALKLDPECTAAYYYWGKSYQEEDRLEDAVVQWKKLCEKIPAAAYLVFGDLERAWFDLGNFSEAEKLYNQILSENPKNVQAALALAKIYDKKGEYDRTLDIMTHLDEEVQNNLNLQSFRIQTLFNKGQYKLSAVNALKILKNEGWLNSQNFTCQECHFVSKKPHWICPQCKAIDSYNI